MCKTISKLSVPKRKTKVSKRLASGLVQQFSLPVSAAAENLGPLVEAGGGGGEHDEEFLLEAQAAHPRGGVVAAGSREDLPGDGVGGALVFQLPDKLSI